jgi:transcriptional regulator with XRE-family HTH domain
METMTTPTLAERLRILRAEKGWSLVEAGKHCRLSPDNLSMIEKGLRKPQIATLRKLAVAYEVDFQELVSLQEFSDTRKDSAPAKGLLDREDVRDWLREKGAPLLLMSDEEFVEMVGTFEQLEDFDDFVRELVAERAGVEDLLNTHAAREALFPKQPIPSSLPKSERERLAMQPGRDMSALRREVRVEYRAREAAVSRINQQLYIEGDIEGFIAREMPPDLVRVLRQARGRARKEMLVPA